MSKQLEEKQSKVMPILSMTPEKAIEILEEQLSFSLYRFDSDLMDALKLAIKALRSQIVSTIKRGAR